MAVAKSGTDKLDSIMKSGTLWDKSQLVWSDDIELVAFAGEDEAVLLIKPFIIPSLGKSTLKRTRKKRFGNLVFFLPIIVLVAIVLFGLYQNTANATGVLSVEAQSSYGSSSHFIPAMATVSGATRQTPYDLTLRPGSYTVTYGAIQWYQTPPPKTVTVLGGTTAYAVGVYVPITVNIGVNGAGFNATQVTAKSEITPVVWTDTGAFAVQLKSTVFNIVLTPGQNYTRVLDSPGKLILSLIGTSATMTVNVV